MFKLNILIVILLFPSSSFGAIGYIQLNDKNIPILYIDVPCYKYYLEQRLEDFPQVPMTDLMKAVQEKLADISRTQERNDQKDCGGITYGFKADRWQITLHEKSLALFALEDIKKLLIHPNITLQVDVFYDDPIY